jgi:Outer membrane receptor proteins, mostly Fe transport
MLAMRAFDGRQIEEQLSTAINSTRSDESKSLTATIPSHDWGASAVWSRSGIFGLENLSVGGDFRHYQGDFNEVDFNTSGAVSGNVASGGAQSLSGAFVQALFSPLTPLHVELSARVDRWDNTDGHAVSAVPGTPSGTTMFGDSSKTAFSPRAGIRYQVTSNLSFHAAYYRAFRAPNLAELYRKQVSPSSITLPNPFLEAENAEGREAGFDFQPADWVQVKGTWYVADYNNFNVPTNLAPAGDPSRPAECGDVARCRTRLNVNKSRSEGGEAYIALRPIQQLFVSGSVNYDDARQQSGLAATVTDDNKPHINRVPSPKQTIRATWTSPKYGEWTAMWRHEGTTTTLRGDPLAPYSVVDMNVQREVVPGVRGFVSVENVGDTRYEVNLSGDIMSLGLPRTVRVGVEAYRF